MFILDACFSSQVASTFNKLTGAMQDEMNRMSSYAFLCSSFEATTSIDTSQGGEFTKALCNIAKSGRSDGKYRRRQYLTVQDIQRPLQDRLSKDGCPLSRLFVGPNLPDVPLFRNVSFNPIVYKFGRELRDVVLYMWNKGHPREVAITDLTNVSKGAYGNHTKLNYAPWALAEYGQTKRRRKLTSRGIRFAQGKLSIPESIFEDPDTDQWVPLAHSKRINIKSIK